MTPTSNSGAAKPASAKPAAKKAAVKKPTVKKPAAKTAAAKKPVTKTTVAKTTTAKAPAAKKAAAKPRAKKKPVAPSIALKEAVLAALEDAKAENIIAIDITDKTAMSDYMVVASGRSHRHVGAVADQLSRALREKGFEKPRIEGLPHCDWVLVDAGDIIIHIFRPEVRDFYNIEKMWSADFSADAQ